MAIYCWGNTAHGELGLGGIEEEQVGIISCGSYLYVFIYVFVDFNAKKNELESTRFICETS